MIWFIFGVLIWALLMFLVTPLLSKKAATPEYSTEIETYKAEIARLSADIETGEDPELEARKIDLQRQLLELTKKTEEHTRPNLMLINSLFLFFTFGAIGLYAMLGSPELTKPGALTKEASQQTASTNTSNRTYDQDAAMTDLLGQLKARLDGDQKNDPDGWVLYARTLMNIGRYEEAFQAYETVLEITNNHPDAIKELELARKYAAENADKAVSAPTSGATQPAPMRGPSPEDIAAAANMSPEDRTAMIENMVEGLAARLAANPQDDQGWIRLLKARKVLSQTEQAAKDIESIKAAYPGRDYMVTDILNASGWNE